MTLHFDAQCKSCRKDMARQFSKVGRPIWKPVYIRLFHAVVSDVEVRSKAAGSRDVFLKTKG